MNCVGPCPIQHYRKSLAKFDIKKTYYNIKNGDALDVLVYTFTGRAISKTPILKKSVCNLMYVLQKDYSPAWLQ